MLTIRFARVGKKNKAQFKITLQEKTVAPGGRHIEILGSYDPHSKQAILKDDRIKYWLGKGAQASDTVWNLLVSKGLITDKKRAVKMPACDAKQSDAGGPAKKVEENIEEKEAPKTEEAIKEEKPVEASIKASKEEAKIEEKISEEPKEEAKKEEPKIEEVKTEEKKEEAPAQKKEGEKTE